MLSAVLRIVLCLYRKRRSCKYFPVNTPRNPDILIVEFTLLFIHVYIHVTVPVQYMYLYMYIPSFPCPALPWSLSLDVSSSTFPSSSSSAWSAWSAWSAALLFLELPICSLPASASASSSSPALFVSFHFFSSLLFVLIYSFLINNNNTSIYFPPHSAGQSFNAHLLSGGMCFPYQSPSI